jgi:hypothetical protein
MHDMNRIQQPLTERVAASLRASIPVVEAVEALAFRLLGFAALMYELIRGFFHGK